MIEHAPDVRPRRWAWFRPALLLLALALIAWPFAVGPAVGQQDPDANARPAPAAEPKAAPSRSHDDTVPRGAVQAYLDACREGDFGLAARYLKLPHGSELPGPTLARHLKVVLDQKLWVDMKSLSDRPSGNLEDGLAPDVDLVGIIDSKRGEFDILVERVREGTREVWRFSPSTVEAVPALYEEYGYGPLGEYLPHEFFVFSFLEIQLWQWLGLFLLVFLAYAAAWIATRLAASVLSRVTARTANDLDDQILAVSLRPLYLILAVALFHVGAVTLHLSVPVREGLAGLERALVIIASVWVVVKLVDVFAARAKARLEEEGRQAAVAIIPMGSKGAKAALFILGFIALLQNLGFNVTGILAGLGVGGIAVALAAQKSLENLFGGIMLVLDQPVRVGDFCRWTDKVGVVEEVGLRSTRIRTLDRTLVTIPNAEFSNIQVENFAVRDRMRLFIILQLRYETTADQLRHVLAGLRKLLLAHPRITSDPARVKFVNFGSYSLDLEVFAYADTKDWGEFLDIREDIFLRMIDVVDKSGTGFAFPSQTTYLSRDTGLNEKAAKAAEEEVASWRESGKLPFPAFSPETISSTKDSLDYPPRGSESTREGASG